MTETAHAEETDRVRRPAAPGPAGPPLPAVRLPLADALVRITHLVQREFAEASRSHGLPPQQAQLLCQLVEGPVGMTELSRTMNLEKSSLSGLVDRVVRRGLVERTRDSSDRRACRITLTDTGARLGDAAHGEVVARLDALAAGLPAADRAVLASLLGRLVTGTGADPAGPPAA
ncbi:MarR family winged helix-turn-helix transcriptional regulator [Nocardiopsis mangrovi]|uniref:MarR family winged helix-turn-helix transcriptional regulator n=1 Tax=Nocardiopsis mangrovi TaxID=1179818 RepID=A0ABV9E4Z8_9ACTN